MRSMGARRRITTWRAKADSVQLLIDEMPPGIRLEARGYIEAMRECAAQLELTLDYATKRPNPER